MEKEVLDSCILDRTKTKPEKNNIFKITVSLLFINILVLIIISQKKLKMLTQIITILTWYYIIWNLLVFLKKHLGDKNCNDKNNSISGHFNFIVFSNLALFYMYIEKYKNNHKVLSIQVLYFLFCIFVGYETYFNVNFA
jgi:hypothetical protein